MIDGDLRKLFKKNLPNFDWTFIETGSITQGVPDTNTCYNGIELWIEFKQTTNYKLTFRSFQPQWIHRRVWHGGRVWIAARQVHNGGPRLGEPVDTLWLFQGDKVLEVIRHGLHMSLMAGKWHGGPGHWDWKEIGELLLSPPPPS